jgi:hypothetical protein
MKDFTITHVGETALSLPQQDIGFGYELFAFGDFFSPEIPSFETKI